MADKDRRNNVLENKDVVLEEYSWAMSLFLYLGFLKDGGIMELTEETKEQLIRKIKQMVDLNCVLSSRQRKNKSFMPQPGTEIPSVLGCLTSLDIVPRYKI